MQTGWHERWLSALARRLPRPSPMPFANALNENCAKNRQSRGLVEDVMEIGRHCASLPLLDRRRHDEILGYDENGLPR